MAGPSTPCKTFSTKARRRFAAATATATATPRHKHAAEALQRRSRLPGQEGKGRRGSARRARQLEARRRAHHGALHGLQGRRRGEPRRAEACARGAYRVPKAIELYKKVFGAEELYRLTMGPEKSIGELELARARDHP